MWNGRILRGPGELCRIEVLISMSCEVGWGILHASRTITKEINVEADRGIDKVTSYSRGWGVQQEFQCALCWLKPNESCATFRLL